MKANPVLKATAIVLANLAVAAPFAFGLKKAFHAHAREADRFETRLAECSRKDSPARNDARNTMTGGIKKMDNLELDMEGLLLAGVFSLFALNGAISGPGREEDTLPPINIASVIYRV